MSSITAEERMAMAESFRRLLARSGGQADLRRAMAGDLGYDPALWREVAAMGLAGLIIDPLYGGVGAGAATLEAIMEQAGAALFSGPLLASSILAAGFLGRCTDAAVKQRLLPGIASGDRIAALALTGEAGTWVPDGIAVTARRGAAGWRLDGTASYVLAGNAADTLLVMARTGDGFQGFEIDPAGAGIALTPLQSFDRTLRLSRLDLMHAAGNPIEGADWPAVEAALDLARVALAGEQIGGARQVFDQTIAYIKTRIQFGRPIGGFQAIKHMAADLLLELENAVSAARHAAQALEQASREADEMVALAGFVCADTFVRIAADSIQMQGGIAFTWDHPTHLYLRRARADAQLFGTPSFYRERYLSILEGAA